jgi:hypothetical protein
VFDSKGGGVAVDELEVAGQNVPQIFSADLRFIIVNSADPLIEQRVPASPEGAVEIAVHPDQKVAVANLISCGDRPTVERIRSAANYVPDPRQRRTAIRVEVF